ncbi:MAG: DNA helicase [Bacteriovoracaceae bacterium]
MKLSSPIYVLKSKAKALKKTEGITMAAALDRVATEEGCNSWSLLMSKTEDLFPQKYSELLDFFNDGDLVVVGSRPGIGKTSFTIGLFVQAIERKRAKSFCFTLSETHKDIARRIASYNQEIGHNEELFSLNYSNDICADYIISETEKYVSPGSVIIVDYLQLLDEKRENPSLQEQVLKLKTFSKKTGTIILFLSQIDREIEYRSDKRPTIEDLRLPNPLDLGLFNKGLFLYRESKDSKEVEVNMSGKTKCSFRVGWNSKEVSFFDL